MEARGRDQGSRSLQHYVSEWVRFSVYRGKVKGVGRGKGKQGYQGRHKKDKWKIHNEEKSIIALTIFREVKLERISFQLTQQCKIEHMPLASCRSLIHTYPAPGSPHRAQSEKITNPCTCVGFMNQIFPNLRRYFFVVPTMKPRSLRFFKSSFFPLCWWVGNIHYILVKHQQKNMMKHLGFLITFSPSSSGWRPN